MSVIESQIYLRNDHPALKGSAFVEAQRLTRDWLLSQQHVAAAITREQILSGGLNGPLETALRLSFHPRRSGDVLFCLEPYDIQGNVAATHGSPWDYDTHVPLLVLEQGHAAPAARVPAGEFRRRVSPACIAPDARRADARAAAGRLRGGAVVRAVAATFALAQRAKAPKPNSLKQRSWLWLS